MDEQMIERLYEWHDEAVELGYGEMRVPTEWITAARAAHSVMAARLAELEERLRSTHIAPGRDESSVEYANGYEDACEMAADLLAALAPHPKGTGQ